MRKIVIVLLLCVCSNAYGAYTGTMPKDIGTSTPAGTESPGIIDDVIRERGTIQYNLYKLKFVGTDTTLAANDTWVVGSSSTAMLITMPAASSCANTSVTKPFVIKNYSTGTITLNISVDGVGSPTVSGSQTMSLFTDGTNWYEIGVKNAYDSEYLGGVIAGNYARSGVNSDITAITGLTTYLAVGQGGSGTDTAAGAASAFGVGTEDSPTFTGVTATTGSTTTHTSTTITATTGNITNISATTGTYTGNVQVGSMSGLEDADIPPDITLTNITQITNRSHNDITGTGTYSHPSVDSHIDDSTDPHGASLTQTNAMITTGTTTTSYSTTSNITTGNITNLVTTTGTVGTLYNTNISGNAGTFSGNVNAASVSGYDYLRRWRSGTVIGTDTIAFAGSGDIIVTASYSNGKGTVTISLSGSATVKPNIKLNGVQIIANAENIDFTTALNVVGSGSTEAIVSVNPISLATQTTGLLSLATQTTGLLSLATQTTGLLSLATQTTGLLSLATQTTGSATASQLPLISSLSGSATSAQLPSVIRLPGTTTESAAGAYGQLYVQSASVFSSTGSATGFGTLTTASLASYYRLSDLSDSFGGNSLTNIGTTSFVAGKYGNCATFNGTSQYLQVPIFSTTTTNISMFGWVYIASASEMRPFFNNGIDGADTNGYALVVGDTSIASSGNNLIGHLHGVATLTFGSAIGTGWHHVGMTRDSTTWRGYVDGVQAPNTFTDNPTTPSGNFTIGRNNASAVNYYFNDKIDDVVFYNKTLSAGEIQELYNNTGRGITYTQYSAKYKDPVIGNTVFEILTPGTQTTEANYIYCNASTTVFGLGTNTAITATTTIYAGWSAGAVRATAFNVASSEKIKKNIKDIEISPGLLGLLDAETEAKPKYISDNKVAWVKTNKHNYESVVNETGTGSVTKLDTQVMEAAYSDYIELAWASDLNRNTLITAVQQKHKAEFWLKFDSIRPRQWNPTENPSLIRSGFVVEESPDNIKGDDQQSIDPMKVIVIQQQVLQSLRAESKNAIAEIGSLTAALENQKIAYNEEVDNLYLLINAVIVAVLAIGGVNGWATVRRKRKGT